jgi:quercetin dioxygenase-like cupin family protein
MIRSLLLVVPSFAAGVLLATWANPVVSAQFRSVETKELLRADLGTWCPGKEVIISVQQSGPGVSAKHYHPGHTFTWVIEGSETRTVEGKPLQVARTGEVMREEPMEIGSTQNTEPVKLLHFRIFEKGKPATTNVP